MDSLWLYILALLIGSIIFIIGVAYIILNITNLCASRARNIVEGIGYFLFGALMILLGMQGLLGYRTIGIDLGISESQSAVFLLIIGVGAFALKLVFNIREGRERLRDKTLSPFLIFKNRLQIITTIIFLLILGFGLISFLSQLNK